MADDPRILPYATPRPVRTTAWQIIIRAIIICFWVVMIPLLLMMLVGFIAHLSEK